MHCPTAGCVQMVTNVLYDLHKHLHLPQPGLKTAGWMGCHAQTVMENQVLPASQLASLTRKSGIQPVKLPGCLCWASRKCGLLQCGLCTPEEPAGRQHASHSDIHPANIQPTNTQLCLPPSIPLQLLFSVPPPSFFPQAPCQLNIVPSNPTGPQGSGSANQAHTPNEVSLSYAR